MTLIEQFDYLERRRQRAHLLRSLAYALIALSLALLEVAK